MSHWNYRVFRVKRDDETFYEIREVYYEGEEITFWTMAPTDMAAETIEGLGWVLDQMKGALAKPVLDEVELLSKRRNK